MNEKKYAKATVLSRGIDVLLVIKNNKVATVHEIHRQAMPDLSERTVQRYMHSLQKTGLVRGIGEKNNHGYRYFLTPKAKQLFGVSNDK